MDWDICFICQDLTEEPCRGIEDGGCYDTLSTLLPKFAELGRFNIEKFESRANDPETIKELFTKNKAVYHHTCVSRYNKQKLCRALKRKLPESEETCSSSSNNRPKRSDPTSKILLGELKCVFCIETDSPKNLCAAGTMHASSNTLNQDHVFQFTERMKARALKLGETQIFARFSTGDVTTNELFYHKHCLATFNNRYQSAILKEQRSQNQDSVETEFQKELRFNQVIFYINEQRKAGIEVAFEVSFLENLYKDLLENDGIVYSCHSSRFYDRLKLALPEIEKRIIKAKAMICFSVNVNDVLEKEIAPSSFIKALMKIVNPIRQDMSQVENSFDGSFSESCQEESVPLRLLTLCSLLIDGCDPRRKGVSQSALSISQLVMREYRKKWTNDSTIRKHSKFHETPVPTYIGLKVYATVRSRTLIDKLFHLGICISYDRVLDISNSIAYSILQKYEQNQKVFVPNLLRLELFTIIAKDNIDFNTKSTKVSQHFHGISMTAMQFLTHLNDGTIQQPLYDFGSDHSKFKLQFPLSIQLSKNFLLWLVQHYFAPVCTINISKTMSVDKYGVGKDKEYTWLEQVVSCINISDGSCCSWSAFYSEQEVSQPPKPVGVHALMPLIHEKVATLKAQFHCMNIIKDTIKFINPSQIPIDVSDQPVYALSKEIQLRHPSYFGADKYTNLFGDLHIEIELLRIHGELIKGSGLDSILESTSLSTLGTSAIIDVNNNKRARYCLQVSSCTIYQLLKEAQSKSDTSTTPTQWLEQRSKISQMCFYWKLILEFQIHVLLFVRSIRQGNFQLYLETLYQSLKYFFAFDKYNYSRWATIYWFDMASLHLRCPAIYKEFMDGNFSFQKTNTSFSKIALDQLHEQNNKYVKGVSGATSLVNRSDDSALNRWQLCGPELSRLLNEFEMNVLHESEPEDTKKHHEDNLKFQTDFLNDVKKLHGAFPNNPFEMQNLTVINKIDVEFEENIYYNLSRLEDIGSKQVEEYIENRLLYSKVAINTKISLNHLILLGDEGGRRRKGAVVDKRLTSSFLTKLRAAISYRREHAKLLFKTEIFATSQSLAADSNTLYHGTKSDILRRFNQTSSPEPSNSSAILIELSPILRLDFNADTFLSFSLKVYRHIIDLGKTYDRIDVIFDRYFENSLKTQTRDERGSGTTIPFDENSPFPKDFKENFLKNSSNKEKLNHYLASKFINFHHDIKPFTVTKGSTIESNDSTLLADSSITTCEAEEADQRLIRHMLQCVRSGLKYITIKTVDTDILMLALAYRHSAQNFDSKVNVILGIGKSIKYFDINAISSNLGEQTCKALPFFHAFSGCDCVSSFFNQGKCKLWDRWQEFTDKEALTRTFCELSTLPPFVSANQIAILEKYVLFLYYNKICSPIDIDIQRMHDFEHSTHNNLRLLPPSKAGLIEHIKRASFEAGWVSYMCIQNVSLPDPQQWGWMLINRRYFPKWQDVTDPIDPYIIISTCSCVKSKCSKCQCAKRRMECLLFCKCQRKCKN